MSFLNSIPQTRFGRISPRATSRYRSLRSLRARLAALHFGMKSKNERRRPYAECARSANPQLSDCRIAFTLDSARAEQHILCCSSRAELDRGGNAFLQSESVTTSRGTTGTKKPRERGFYQTILQEARARRRARRQCRLHLCRQPEPWSVCRRHRP